MTMQDQLDAPTQRELESTGPSYRVMNAISRSYMLEQIDGMEDGEQPHKLELIRNSVTKKLNPLLAEVSLYDVVTLSGKTITTLRKATHAEIRSFIPNALLKGEETHRYFELSTYLEAKAAAAAEADYVPAVLDPGSYPLPETPAPQVASNDTAPLREITHQNGSAHHLTNGVSVAATDIAE